jgi:hypothetical protein
MKIKLFSIIKFSTKIKSNICNICNIYLHKNFSLINIKVYYQIYINITVYSNILNLMPERQYSYK